MLLDNEIIKTDSYTNFSVYLSVFLSAKYKKVFRKKVLILMKKDSLAIKVSKVSKVHIVVFLIYWFGFLIWRGYIYEALWIL